MTRYMAGRKVWMQCIVFGLVALLLVLGMRPASAQGVPDPIDPDNGEAVAA